MEDSRLFSALLRYWRKRRGLSQLDLALTADVSARHISYMETGRSKPSPEMVLLIAATLDLPLRERNAMLRAAGFAAFYEEPGGQPLAHLPEPVLGALEQMMDQHEPFPMMVMDRCYNVLKLNRAATQLLTFVGVDVTQPFNVIKVLFEPSMLKPLMKNWEETAREVLTRLQRESLHHDHVQGLKTLLDEILAMEGVPASWKRPDLSTGQDCAYVFRMALPGHDDLAFLTTMMRFSAPQNVVLDELQIESYFPYNPSTRQFCQALAPKS